MVLILGIVPWSSAAPGVTDVKIRIGVHIPLTGASPIASDTAVKGARLLWRWMKHKDEAIHGRDVRVIVRNDQFNPAHAVAVCREMVEEKHVFMLSGMPSQSSNGDQMEACARYAASVGVPYVSLGSNEERLRNLENHFATTMTFDDQASLLADYLLDGRRARRSVNGIVSFNTPLYTEAHEAFVRAMENRGAALGYERRIAHTSGTADARRIVQEMQVLGVENVVILTSPVFMLNVLNQAGSAGFHPLWTGPGLTITANDAVPGAACPNDSGHRVRFFSAMPAFVDRDSFDRAYDRAVEAVYPGTGNGDGFMWQGWATSKALRSMLRAAGPDLNRRRFIRRVETMKPIRNGILPSVRFTERNHFGGRATHVLRMNCSTRSWTTARKFVRNFGG